MIPFNGILLIYRHPFLKDASTIMEHVNAFKDHSRFRVWSINTELGFPRSLRNYSFQAILLHYSVFGWVPGMERPPALDQEFLDYLAHAETSYKIAFFQDENLSCQARFRFINRYHIDCVYTLVEPQFFKDVYQKYTQANKLVYTLTGYVSDQLIKVANEYSKPDNQRLIHVGYRGRRLPFYMGKGAQEKTQIAEEFLKRADGLGLNLDIETEERKRLYGKDWYRFLGNCQAVLGVEAGVSIFDLEDKVRPACDDLISQNPNISLEEISEKVLAPWEDNLFYRTISPRHFEAAAFRILQILYEGKYSGILQPMVHYIPLKKDYSNFDEVIRLFNDPALRKELTDNAYRDLIASGKYTYQHFIQSFDGDMLDAGLKPEIDAMQAAHFEALFRRQTRFIRPRALLRIARYYPFPGRSIVYRLSRPLIHLYRSLKPSLPASTDK